MKLTLYEQDMLDGAHGEAKRIAMEKLVEFGVAVDAKEMAKLSNGTTVRAPSCHGPRLNTRSMSWGRPPLSNRSSNWGPRLQMNQHAPVLPIPCFSSSTSMKRRATLGIIVATRCPKSSMRLLFGVTRRARRWASYCRSPARPSSTR